MQVKASGLLMFQILVSLQALTAAEVPDKDLRTKQVIAAYLEGPPSKAHDPIQEMVRRALTTEFSGSLRVIDITNLKALISLMINDQQSVTNELSNLREELMSQVLPFTHNYVEELVDG